MTEILIETALALVCATTGIWLWKESEKYNG